MKPRRQLRADTKVNPNTYLHEHGKCPPGFHRNIEDKCEDSSRIEHELNKAAESEIDKDVEGGLGGKDPHKYKHERLKEWYGEDHPRVKQHAEELKKKGITAKLHIMAALRAIDALTRDPMQTLRNIVMQAKDVETLAKAGKYERAAHELEALETMVMQVIESDALRDLADAARGDDQGDMPQWMSGSAGDKRKKKR